MSDSVHNTRPFELRVSQGFALQDLRALCAWLGWDKGVIASFLGIHQQHFGAILRGDKLPSDHTKGRVAVLSERWPYGIIAVESWPERRVWKQGEDLEAPAKWIENNEAPLSPEQRAELAAGLKKLPKRQRKA